MNNLKSFNVDASVIQFWVVKGKPGKYRIANTSNNLEISLKEIKKSCLSNYSVSVAYDAGAVVAADELIRLDGPVPQWDEIKKKIDGQLSPSSVDSIEELNNSEYYVIKYTNPSGEILYAAKKCPSDWKVRKSKESVAIYFSGKTLDNAEDAIFSISKTFDFFVLNDIFYILEKKKFESILGYKDAYKKHFDELKNDPVFLSKFSGIKFLEDYVGDNSIQLGRMSAALTKEKFKDAVYLQKMKALGVKEGWGLKFDKGGKFLFTQDNTRTMILLLLGHRVKSICGRETLDASGLSAI